MSSTTAWALLLLLLQAACWNVLYEDDHIFIYAWLSWIYLFSRMIHGIKNWNYWRGISILTESLYSINIFQQDTVPVYYYIMIIPWFISKPNHASVYIISWIMTRMFPTYVHKVSVFQKELPGRETTRINGSYLAKQKEKALSYLTLQNCINISIKNRPKEQEDAGVTVSLFLVHKWNHVFMPRWKWSDIAIFRKYTALPKLTTKKITSLL